MDYITSLNKNRVLKNGVYGYYEPYRMVNGLNKDFIEFEPKRNRFHLDNNENWDIKFMYPYKKDNTKFIIADGIKINSIKIIELDNNNYFLIETPIKHNINLNVDVNLKIIDEVNGVKTEYLCQVFGLGDENGLNSEYKVIFKIGNNKININSKNLRFKRTVGSVDSEYYVRVFKEIENTNNKYIDNIILSKGFNKDNNYQMILEDMVDGNKLKNNYNGLPLTDIYIYFEKKEDPFFFTKISKGFKLFGNAGETKLNNICKIHNRVDRMVSDEDLGSDSEGIYGDICEFNLNEFKEYVLCDVYHRFNTINREYTIDSMGVDNKIKYSILTSKGVYTETGVEIIKKDVILNYDVTKESTIYNTYGETKGVKIYTLKNGSFKYENTITPNEDSYCLENIKDLNLNAKEIIGLTNEPRLEGYIYKCLYNVPIREFSDTLFSGGKNSLKPDYAKEVVDGSGIYIWRNLKDRSKDNLNLPIKNNCIYVFNKIKFSIKRQDIDGTYGLNKVDDLTNVNIDYVELNPETQTNIKTLCQYKNKLIN